MQGSQFNLLKSLNDGLQRTAEAARRGIVRIGAAGHGYGTGILVRADGLILTSAHVVKHRYPHIHLSDGRRLRGHVLARDQALDLAALAVEAADLPHLTLDDCSTVRPGDLVLASGHPWGVAGAVTTGVVHTFGTYPLPGHRPRQAWLVCDAHLRPGHSGGPILNSEGRVIGVNTMLISPDLGVAVPAHVAQAFLARFSTNRPVSSLDAAPDRA